MVDTFIGGHGLGAGVASGTILGSGLLGVLGQARR
jgi:hypothetical protein